MADFDVEYIHLTTVTDLWGPFRFSFPVASSATANDGVLPFGTTLATVSVEAYLGSVKRTSTLASETNVTSDIIDPSYTPQITGSDAVLVKFQHPGESYANRGQKATLRFVLTLSNGGKHAKYFQYVVIN